MSEAKFVTGSLMRHVMTMTVTSSIGILAIFAVDFVDVIFISMIGQAELAAAVGYAGSLLFFTNSINIGLSIAAGALVAKSLGADEEVAAKEHATSVAMLGVLTSILIPLLVMSRLDALMGLLGAEGETLRLAVRYCSIILPTMMFMSIAMMGMAVLRAYGEARASMMVTLAGGAVNAALDPLLIFGFGLGLDGAALASVAARLTMAGYAMWVAIRRVQGFAPPSLGLLRRDFLTVAVIAGPAIMTNLATPIGNAFITREMAKFGTEAVAAMAVIGRLTPMAFSVVLALSGAIGPIVGQNYGAGQFDRVRTALADALKFAAFYVVVATVILFLLRNPIAGIFEATGEMRALIFLFCGPLALAQFFNAAIFVCNASFNNLGHPIYSTWVNWGRHTIGTLPFAIAGGAIAGASGVLIGQAAGGLIFMCVAVWLARRVIDDSDPNREVAHFTEERRLHQVTGQRHW